MSWLDIGLLYLSGLISGIAAMTGIVLHLGNKILLRDKKKLEGLKTQLGDIDSAAASVETRMLRLREIAELQMELHGAADGPQRNAMDGRYKNSINKTLKELEEEKIAILTSIVSDGHDPSVNVLRADGTTETTKLSEFLAGHTSDTINENDTPVKQVGKFTVLKGGKDDGGTPTTH